MHNIPFIEYFWALFSKISVGLVKIWGFYLEIYLVSVILWLLVSVENTDTILFTLSFDDTKPLFTRDWETSKGFGKKVEG